MLSSLFKSLRRARPAAAAVPEGRRVYAIGDIHGRADLLARLRETIVADALAAGSAQCVVIHVGDYVDRGFHAREVVDLLIDSALPDFESVHIKGNHEEMMLRFLDDPAAGPLWLANGGDVTLASYRVGGWRPPLDDEGLEVLRDRLRDALPPRHEAFLRGLPVSHVEGDYLFVHAGLRPGVPVENQTEQDMLWIREEFLDSRADHGKIVVHGHSINYQPEEHDNRIAIDTGAFATGHLTCLVLEGTERWILAT